MEAEQSTLSCMVKESSYVLSVNTGNQNVEEIGNKNCINAVLAYVHQFPQCIFGFASAQQQSQIWQPSILQMALLFLLCTPQVTLNKQNLSMSNSLVCVVAFFFYLFTCCSPTITATHIKA